VLAWFPAVLRVTGGRLLVVAAERCEAAALGGLVSWRLAGDFAFATGAFATGVGCGFNRFNRSSRISCTIPRKPNRPRSASDDGVLAGA